MRPSEIQEVPCGKCIGCRIDYSRQWATRCMLEAQKYNNNAFITLTYDQDHIKYNKKIDEETGEISKIETLVPEDLTKFIKDLRRYYKYHYNHEGIRFYACGEYGSKTERPHYHIICFNLPIEDKKIFFKNINGNNVYLSESIQKIWGKGIISIGEVTWESAAYTARYVMKKMKGPGSEEYYKEKGVIPEFVRMSRSPGIAWDYYNDNKEKIYKNDEIILTNKKGKAKVVKPSKYYDRLFDLDNPEAMKAIKEKRKEIAQNAMELQLEKTNLNKKEYLALKERNKAEKLKKLIRPIEA